MATRAFSQGKLRFDMAERDHAMWWARESLILSEIEADEHRHLEEVLVNLLSGIISVTRPDKRQERAERINDVYASIQHLLEPFNFGSVAARVSIADRLVALWKATCAPEETN